MQAPVTIIWLQAIAWAYFLCKLQSHMHSVIMRSALDNEMPSLLVIVPVLRDCARNTYVLFSNVAFWNSTHSH